MGIESLFGGGGAGGIFGALFNIASMMTPMGWAMQAAKMLMTAVGEQLIQKLGEMLGLPQSIIDAAQGAMAAAAGDTQGAQRNIREAVEQFGNEMGMSPQQQGEMERTGNDALNNFVATLSESEEFKQAKASGGKGGGSWLMALAAAFGDRLNKKAESVQSLANQITDKTPDKTAKFGAASSEFSILMNAVNNAIKTIGEGIAQGARKG
jgi:uncharacterized protein YPO0396